MTIEVKRAVRASRNICENVMTSHERHPSLPHLTSIEIFQISVCQMSADKRLKIFYVPLNYTAKLRYFFLVGKNVIQHITAKRNSRRL